MTSDGVPEEIKKDTGALCKSALCVTDFYEGVALPKLAKLRSSPATLTERLDTIFGLYLRAHACMRTLRRLNDPADLQVLVSISRTLLEVATDLILVVADPTDETADKMRFWEESAKLRRAEKILAYYASQGKSVPEEYKPAQAFAAREGSSIQAKRLSFWRDDKHPMNGWDNRPLPDRLDEAERKDPVVGGELKELYHTEYGHMCWHSHSGLTGVRNIPPHTFYNATAIAFKLSSELAIIAAKVVLRGYGVPEAEIDAEIRNLETQMALAWAAARV